MIKFREVCKMIDIKVYHNHEMKQYYFYDLLAGMQWLESHVMIDYIVIDDDTIVTWEEWDIYFEKLNFCKKVYGYNY
jgi:hypothetical protein